MRVHRQGLVRFRGGSPVWNIARFDVEKAFSCGMEAVHIAEKYALTYCMPDGTGNRAPVIVQRAEVSSIERW